MTTTTKFPIGGIGWCIFLHLICLLVASHALAQKSILRNGGFEEHGKQQCLSCYQSSGQYGAIVYHWDNGGWHCMLCTKDYKQHSDDIKGQVCPMDRISPQSGKAMISMLLLNSGDTNAYQKWLPVLQQACESGELPWIMYAKCYDQSMLGQGKLQRYLTDYTVLDDDSVTLPPWEGDENTVNDRRAKIGLSLLPKIVTDAMKKEE